jgi:hypothetical protein
MLSHTLSPSFQHLRKFSTLKGPITITQTGSVYYVNPTGNSFPSLYYSWRGFVFGATRAAGKITGMKESIESLTKKVSHEILDKKLEEKLDKGG